MPACGVWAWTRSSPIIRICWWVGSGYRRARKRARHLFHGLALAHLAAVLRCMHRHEEGASKQLARFARLIQAGGLYLDFGHFQSSSRGENKRFQVWREGEVPQCGLVLDHFFAKNRDEIQTGRSLGVSSPMG